MEEEVEDFDEWTMDEQIDKNRECMMKIVDEQMKFRKFQIQKNEIIWEQQEETDEEKGKSKSHSR